MTGSKRIGRRCEFGHWPYADVWLAEGTIVQFIISRPARLPMRESKPLTPEALADWEPIGWRPCISIRPSMALRWRAACGSQWLPEMAPIPRLRQSMPK